MKRALSLFQRKSVTPLGGGKRPTSGPTKTKKVSTDTSSSSSSVPSELENLVLPSLGMFVFYVIHDALQEEMFRYPGFEYGWFMTLAEVVIMLLGGLLSEGLNLQCPPGGARTAATSALIGLCVSGSHGLGNTALRFTTYPLKVAFKSCKLIPTMWLGVCVTGRRHGCLEYCAALVMCGGLVVLTLADVTEHHHHPTAAADNDDDDSGLLLLGPFLLALSTSLDSVVPNLQERLFQQTNARTVDLIFLSNAFMFLLLLLYTVATGELVVAISYCRHQTGVWWVLSLQAASAYCGLRCYLTVIKQHGGVAGVLLGNARKIVTIVLSFLLFDDKLCNWSHVGGLVLIFCGVYLGVMAKRQRINNNNNNKNKQQPNQTVSSPNKQPKHDHVV